MINLTYPERNRKVQVYTFENYCNLLTGDIINGFQIVLPVDIRDVEKDLYKLEIVADNELLLQIPSLPFQVQFDSAQRHNTLRGLDLLCERCEESQLICVADIESAPSRKLKTLRLRFPEHVNLGNIVSSLDTVLSMQIEPYFATTVFHGRSLQQLLCNVSWKVANIETRRKIQGSAAKSTTSKLSDLFERMSTTTTT